MGNGLEALLGKSVEERAAEQAAEKADRSRDLFARQCDFFANDMAALIAAKAAFDAAKGTDGYHDARRALNDASFRARSTLLRAVRHGVEAEGTEDLNVPLPVSTEEEGRQVAYLWQPVASLFPSIAFVGDMGDGEVLPKPKGGAKPSVVVEVVANAAVSDAGKDGALLIFWQKRLKAAILDLLVEAKKRGWQQLSFTGLRADGKPAAAIAEVLGQIAWNDVGKGFSSDQERAEAAEARKNAYLECFLFGADARKKQQAIREGKARADAKKAVTAARTNLFKVVEGKGSDEEIVQAANELAVKTAEAGWTTVVIKVPAGEEERVRELCVNVSADGIEELNISAPASKNADGE